MEVFKQCYKITSELIDHLKSDLEKDTDKINRLLDIRNQIFNNMTVPITDSEKKWGQAILLQDQELLELLQVEKKSIQKKIKELQIKKVSTQKYVNPYQSLQTDGVYYDKKN